MTRTIRMDIHDGETVSSLIVDGAAIPGVAGAIALNPGLAKSSGSIWTVRPRVRGRGVPDLSLLLMPVGACQDQAETEAIRLLATRTSLSPAAVLSTAAAITLRDRAEGLGLIGSDAAVAPAIARAWDLSLPLAVTRIVQ